MPDFLRLHRYRLAINLLALGLCSLSPQAYALVVVSDGSWKSSQTLFSGWETLSYDDSAWSPARAPYPAPTPPGSLIPGTTAQHIWHDPAAVSDGAQGAVRAFFRRTFDLVAQPDQVGIARISVDDDYEFFVNGSRIFENKDGGFASVVDVIDITGALRIGRNVFAIEARDNAWNAPADRLFERVTFESTIQPGAVLLLNGIAVAPAQAQMIAAGDLLQAAGTLPLAIEVNQGGAIEAVGKLAIDGLITLRNGTVAAAAPDAIELKSSGALDGVGAVHGKFAGGFGSRIGVGAGVLQIGDAAQSEAVKHDGSVRVAAGGVLEALAQDKASFGGAIELAGGQIRMATGKVVELKSGASLDGVGAVQSKFAGGFGSRIGVGAGVLQIGDAAQSEAVKHDGSVRVAAGGVLEALAQDKASFGGLIELAGGFLKTRNRLHLASTAKLTGGSGLVGDVVNEGIIQPGLIVSGQPSSAIGELHFSDNLDLLASSELDMDFLGAGGTLQHPALFDRIIVGEALRLAGALRISMLDAVVLNIGDFFDIVVAGSIGGRFDRLELPTLPGGSYFDVGVALLSDSRQALRLTVSPAFAPEPESGALFLIASLAMALARNRRQGCGKDLPAER